MLGSNCCFNSDCKSTLAYNHNMVVLLESKPILFKSTQNAVNIFQIWYAITSMIVGIKMKC